MVKAQVHALPEWCSLQVGTVRDLPQQRQRTQRLGWGENVAWEKDDGLSLRFADYEVQGTHPEGRGQTKLGETGLDTGTEVRSGTVSLRYSHVGEIVDVRLQSLCQWLKNAQMFCDILGENKGSEVPGGSSLHSHVKVRRK